MKVAVTGSAGFIGTAVTKLLRASGFEVIELDKELGFDILTADVARCLDNCTTVIHLAGVLGTEELFATPDLAIDVNIKGSLRILGACALTGTSYVGITVPKVWSNVYQATKTCAQSLAVAWNMNFGVDVSHVRAFNVFGPGQKIIGVQKAVPTFSVRAWRGEPLPIWGDGTQQVDLIYVDEVARILIEAMKYKNGEVIEAGTGIGMSVLELAKIIIDATGSQSEIQYLPMRKGEVPTNICAVGEGWDLLSYRPQFRYSDLVDTIIWYRDVNTER